MLRRERAEPAIGVPYTVPGTGFQNSRVNQTPGSVIPDKEQSRSGVSSTRTWVLAPNAVPARRLALDL